MLKVLRVVDLLRVVNVLSHCDVLSRCTLCRHHFRAITDIPSPRRVRVVVDTGGVVKTLRRSNSLFILSVIVVLLVRRRFFFSYLARHSRFARLFLETLRKCPLNKHTLDISKVIFASGGYFCLAM